MAAVLATTRCLCCLRHYTLSGKRLASAPQDRTPPSTLRVYHTTAWVARAKDSPKKHHNEKLGRHGAVPCPLAGCAPPPNATAGKVRRWRNVLHPFW